MIRKQSCHGLGLGHGSRVMRVTGQLTDGSCGSRGSRVTKCDPLSALRGEHPGLEYKANLLVLWVLDPCFTHILHQKALQCASYVSCSHFQTTKNKYIFQGGANKPLHRKCFSAQLNLTSRPAIAGIPRCKNITAKSVHLTSLYPTALTSTNDHSSVLRHYVCTQCKIMQHLGVNFGGIWRFELFSLSGFFNFLLRKSGLIFKRPVATLLVTCM